MEFEKFLRGISFRLLQPMMPFPGRRFGGFRYPHFRRRLEWWNTRLAYDPRDIRAILWEPSMIPHMSSFVCMALLNQAVACMPGDQCYVNVGIWQGFSLIAAALGNERKECIGVDNFSEFGCPKSQCMGHVADYAPGRRMAVHDMDYRDYFAHVHRSPIGVYFYDGLHAYEHQLEGLRIAEPFFAPGCLVFVDDMNIDGPHRATQDFLAERSGAYETLFHATTYGDCHPTYWDGLMILRRR